MELKWPCIVTQYTFFISYFWFYSKIWLGHWFFEIHPFSSSTKKIAADMWNWGCFLDKATSITYLFLCRLSSGVPDSRDRNKTSPPSLTPVALRGREMWTKGSYAELQGWWFKCYQTLAHHSLLYWLDHPDQRMTERATDDERWMQKSLQGTCPLKQSKTHMYIPTSWGFSCLQSGCTRTLTQSFSLTQ